MNKTQPVYPQALAAQTFMDFWNNQVNTVFAKIDKNNIAYSKPGVAFSVFRSLHRQIPEWIEL